LAPDIKLSQGATEGDRAGGWNIAWLVENAGADPLEILAVRLPHGQFKAEERRFAPPLELGPRQSHQFKILVHCDEPAGLVTENAFVIFSVIWRAQPWRIFVRIRVAMASDSKPATAIELVTTQRIGFSEAPS
jgi:hypothetical protein